ncbi:MAG: hypothetical protein AAF957_18505 [Planctomycetota bacterium]
MLLTAAVLLAQAPCLARPIAPAGTKYPAFGRFMAVEGDRLMVGNQEPGIGPFQPEEALLVFERDPVTGDWNEIDSVPISDAPGGICRARNIVLDDNSALVLDDAGIVHEIVRDPMSGDWSQGPVVATPGLGEWTPGLAIFEDVALIGYPNASPSRVDVLERAPAGWAVVDTLTKPQSFHFGASIDYDGRFVVAGAPGANGDNGQIFFYTRQISGDFTEAGDGGPVSAILEGFGENVAVFGEVVAASAPRNQANSFTLANVGVVFVYQFAPVQQRWVLVQTLFDEPFIRNAQLGYRLEAGDGYLAASALDTAGPGNGVVVLYRLNPFTNLFRLERTLRGGPSGPPFDGVQLGRAVGISNSLVLAAQSGPNQIGVEPLANTDCNGDGTLDSCEILLGDAFELNRNSFPDDCEETGIRYCTPAAANSTGASARMAFFGPPRTALLYVNLYAEGLPVGSTGGFLASMFSQAATDPAMYVGTLCVGGGGPAYPNLGGPRVADRDGRARVLSNRAVVPDGMGGLIPILPGDTWYFQYWYQDSATMPSGAYSDAIEVTFTLF